MLVLAIWMYLMQSSLGILGRGIGLLKAKWFKFCSFAFTVKAKPLTYRLVSIFL